MRVLVNGLQLFLDVDDVDDVDDQSLLPEGSSMREKPTIVLLHGGSGLDHSISNPTPSSPADIAQVLFLCRR